MALVLDRGATDATQGKAVLRIARLLSAQCCLHVA